MKKNKILDAILVILVAVLLIMAGIKYLNNNQSDKEQDNMSENLDEEKEDNTEKEEPKVDATNAVYHEENSKVTIYEFYGDGCSHCTALNSFLEELSKDNNYNSKFEVKKYEVWYDEENMELLEKILEKFFPNESFGGVPTYIIGDKVFTGYVEDMNDEIKSKIDEEYKNKYIDVLKSLYQ